MSAWKSRLVRRALAPGTGCLLLGCGVPEYRINVTNIPAEAVQLQVATYGQQGIAADSPAFALSGSRSSFSFGLNLEGESAERATVSVAARRADGCLLAVGTKDALPQSASGEDIALPLVVPEPAVSTATCTAAPPVILAVIRRQEGPLLSIRYGLQVQGWGLSPKASLTLQSTARVQCATGSSCNSACPTACAAGGGAVGGPGSGTCLTDCTVRIDEADLGRSGPALIQVNLDPEKNILQQGAAPGSGGTLVQPIDLLLLLTQPLRITMTNPDQSQVVFQEPGQGTLFR